MRAVRVCVYGMCVIPGVRVGELGWGPDGWGAMVRTFCLFFSFTYIAKTGLPKYIHVYTFSCVHMFVVQMKILAWQPLPMSCDQFKHICPNRQAKLGVSSLTLKHEHTPSPTCLQLVDSITAVHLTLAPRVLHPFTRCWCARYFMYPCGERTKVVYSREGKRQRLYSVSGISEVPGVVQSCL